MEEENKLDEEKDLKTFVVKDEFQNVTMMLKGHELYVLTPCGQRIKLSELLAAQGEIISRRGKK